MSGHILISRVRRPRNKAKVTYNRYSYVYDVIGGQFERPYALRGLDLLNVQNGECVLEVGFGTGHIIQALAHHIDYSEDSVSSICSCRDNGGQKQQSYAEEHHNSFVSHFILLFSFGFVANLN